MGKYIKEAQITADKGVVKFNSYCVNHSPFIIWREEQKHDFGIDGEIEFTSITANQRIEVTGEILKVQIKSTERGSYIHNESSESFEFHATMDDFEYWSQHHLAVVLVVYDARNDLLYATTVPKVNPKGSRTSFIPVTFSKASHLLDNKVSDFRSKFSARVRERLEYGQKETCSLNIFKFAQLPLLIYKIKDKSVSLKGLFSDMDRSEIPPFVRRSGYVYMFEKPTNFNTFSRLLLEKNQSETINLKKFQESSEQNFNICIELLKEHFKRRFLSFEFNLGYSKDFDRYYFKRDKPLTNFKRTIEGEPIENESNDDDVELVARKESYTSKKRKSGTETQRKVLDHYTYGKTSFYRHFGFEFSLMSMEGQLYMILNPKYFFTQDGRCPLTDPTQITKLTNYMTSREFNRKILGDIHFLYEFLKGKNSNGQNIIIDSKTGFFIELAPYSELILPFSIPEDQSGANKTMNSKSSAINAPTLF